MTNQPLDRALVLVTIFLAVFAATTLILLAIVVPMRQASAPAPRDTSLAPALERGAPTASRPAGSGGAANIEQPRFGRHDGGFRDAPDVAAEPRSETSPPGPGGDPESAASVERYRFRPLDERELSRFGPVEYEWYRRSGDDWSPGKGFSDGTAPAGEGSDRDRLPAVSDDPRYRFRPIDRVRPAGESGPIPRGASVPPGMPEPMPQWGATPPVPLPHLYPSLMPSDDRRMTTR